MLISLITKLVTLIVKVFTTLIEFLIVVILGLVTAVLFALPWVIRAISIAVWLAAIFIGFTSIQTIYAPFSDAIPLLSLQFTLILIAVAWMMSLILQNGKHFWGGLLVGGLVIGGAAISANWVLAHWVYADLAFRSLPPALFCLLLFYETIHLRSMIQNGLLIKGGDAGDEQKKAAS
jgi:hypothetical protein